jgi:hypothetical protein
MTGVNQEGSKTSSAGTKAANAASGDKNLFQEEDRSSKTG